jgi:Saxitoxin biosynthesis operon protein SxtJ
MNTSKKIPTDQIFGLFIAGLLVILSAYTGYRGADISVVCGLISISFVIGLVAFLKPRLLVPLKKIWLMIGEIMGKIISPITLGIIFFMIITPISIIGRLMGRDELRLKRRVAQSYWVNREPSGPDGDSFKNQY